MADSRKKTIQTIRSPKTHPSSQPKSLPKSEPKRAEKSPSTGSIGTGPLVHAPPARAEDIETVEQPPSSQSSPNHVNGYLRFGLVLIQFCYLLGGYLLITRVFLYPLHKLTPSVYYLLERRVYHFLLNCVGSWTGWGKMQIIECGDKIYNIETKIQSPKTHNVKVTKNIQKHLLIKQKLAKRFSDSVHDDDEQERSEDPPRILMLVNHQCVADVPLLIQMLATKFVLRPLWVLDEGFRKTAFGLVSEAHGDFFIKKKDHVKGSLLKHVLDHKEKNLVILFPEGGFRYKYLDQSIKYAKEKGWPPLHNVLYPRTKAFNELVDDSVKFTHIIELTIIYPEQGSEPTLQDIVMGIKPITVYFHYRVHDLRNGMRGINEDWLRKKWQEKNNLIDHFYKNRETFMKFARVRRNIELDESLVFRSHLFFASVCFICTVSLVKLVKSLFSRED